MVGGSHHSAAVLLPRHHGPGILIGIIGKHQRAALCIQRRRQLRLGGGLHIGLRARNAVLHDGLGVVVPQKQLKEVDKRIRIRLRAGLQEANRTEPVHHDGGGNGIHAKSACQIRRVLCHREGHTLLGSILRQHIVSILGFAGKGNDLYPVLILLIRLLQERELSAAGAAPGSPNIDEHHILFLQHFRQGHSLAVKGGDGEILYLVAHLIGNRFPFGGSNRLLGGSRGLRSGALGGRLTGGLHTVGILTAGAQEHCQRQQQAKQRFCMFHIVFSSRCVYVM